MIRLRRSSSGACSETVALFCGRTDTAGVGGVHGLAEEGEDIAVRAVPVDEAIAMLDAGRIANAKTVVALHWLARNFDRLRRQWA